MPALPFTRASQPAPPRPLSRAAVFFICVVSALALGGCGGGGGGGGGTDSATGPVPAASGAANLLPASVERMLEVPAALAGAPFEQRRLNVPPGFGISLYARVPGARFLARAPNGDVVVSVPGEGKLVLLRDGDGGDGVPQRVDYASDLRNPHDVVFHQIGGTTYVYVSESHRVTRSVYSDGEQQRGAAEVVVDDLPDASTPDLRGNYGHQLKNIALAGDKLYVAIASACNACEEDALADPVRGSVYQFDADGGNGRLVAQGLRNASSINIHPDSGRLWAVVNHRDDVRYPFDNDFTGDGNSDIGQLIPRYVDDNPPDLFTAVNDGAHYGWPFCNAVPNGTMTNLTAVADYETNRNGTRFDCARTAPASKGLPAHSAPLGFSFLQDSGLPAAYRAGAAIGLHGCWNCTTLSAGYKVVFVPVDSAGNAGASIDLVSGFVTDVGSRAFWGRPVDVIADGRGGLLISDDYAGAVYRLHPQQ